MDFNVYQRVIIALIFQYFSIFVKSSSLPETVYNVHDEIKSSGLNRVYIKTKYNKRH